MWRQCKFLVLLVCVHKVHVSKNCFYCEKSDVLQFYSVAKHNRDGTVLYKSRRQGRRPIRLLETVGIALVGLWHVEPILWHS